jgi:hypothetical protein
MPDLLEAAANGDFAIIKRLYAEGVDVTEHHQITAVRGHIATVN